MTANIGARKRPVDWAAKTSGAAKFVLDTLGDLAEPPLWATILRSPHALADLRKVDATKAERMPGVRAVVTAADFGDHIYFSQLPMKDRHPLARDRVRFRGEEIAAVAADTPAQADAGARAIKVGYRRRRPSFTPAAAMGWRAVRLHNRGLDVPNLSMLDEHVHGDIDRMLREGTTTASGTFHYPRIAQAPMEPSACVAWWHRETAKMEIWSTTQAPLILTEVVAEMLDLDQKQVVFREHVVGGGFGARSRTCEYEALTAMLSYKAGRPVVMSFTREEEFTTSRSRHSFDTTMTAFADDDGRLLGFDANIVADNGAYNMTGPMVIAVGVHSLGAMYRPVGVRWSTKLVDTNTVPGGQMRGLGYPQVALASETLVDQLAEQLHQDPLEFRLANATKDGQTTLGGGFIGTSGLTDCLTQVRAAIGWDHKRARTTPFRGVGVAAGMHGAGDNGGRVDANESAIGIDIRGDGRVGIRFGASDFGTHQRTVIAQIVADEIGVPFESIETVMADTESSPPELGQWGSRGTYFAGHAAKKAASEVHQRIRELAVGKFGTDAINIADGVVRCGDDELTIGELVSTADDFRDGALSHESTYVDPIIKFDPANPVVNDISGTYSFAAHAAEVEVDPRTGKITILDYVAAHDIGTALNPSAVEGQIIGGTAMGLGAVLGEDLILKDGRVVNPSYLNYALPRASDLPDIRPILVEGHRDNGPYGAKSCGELPTVLAASAVLNALYAATGIRFESLPVTPDKVIEALRERDGRGKRKFQLLKRPDRWQIDITRKLYPFGVHALLDRFGRKFVGKRPAAVVASVESPETAAGVVAALNGRRGPVGKPSKREGGTAVLGGGTDLHLQRRQGINRDTNLVSVQLVPELRGLGETPSGGLEIGAAVTLRELALDERVPEALRVAVKSIASEQIRAVATVGGNLVQAKRCWFFRNGFDCYKRAGVTAPCYAVTGDHRFYHAAMHQHRCQAVTPSDLGTALVAFDATIVLQGPGGIRYVAAQEFYSGAGETVLGPNEIVHSVQLTAAARRRAASFRKLALYSGDFAVASVTVSFDPAGGNSRVVLGAVAPTPWRATDTEFALDCAASDEEVCRVFDEELTHHGHPLQHNAWKLDASAGLLAGALAELAAERSMAHPPHGLHTDRGARRVLHLLTRKGRHDDEGSRSARAA